MKTITTVREYDDAGRLVKETHVTSDHGVETTDVELRYGATFDVPRHESFPNPEPLPQEVVWTRTPAT